MEIRQRPSASTAGAAGIAAALTVLAEEAEAISTFIPDPGPQVGEGTCGFPSVYINLGCETFCGNFPTESPQIRLSADFNACTGEVDALMFVCDFSADYFFCEAPFNAGDTISMVDFCGVCANSTGFPDYSGFDVDEIFFLGFGFRPSSSSNPLTLGYLEVSFDGSLADDPAFGFTLYSWGVADSAGVPIVATAIPEPGQVSALLGAGCLTGVALFRRLRRKRSLSSS
ncbi:MAG: hypothetical protein ACFE0O_13400 [Opitutales bacterium]